MSAVRVVAPVRVLDAGGWTDTWFAGHGRVCNAAVSPGIEVRAENLGGPPGRALVQLSSFGESYTFAFAEPPGRHPLIETALVGYGRSVRVEISSAVPPGSGLGTSASVCVALLSALALLDDRPFEPTDLAAAAHRLEADALGAESGVQDQLAAAHGGVSVISIDAYPHATRTEVLLAPPTRAELGRRLITVYLGAPHASSAVHADVIARLRPDPGAGPRPDPHQPHHEVLDALRAAAADAATALAAGDLEGYGRALLANTKAQAALHPALINEAARRVFALAKAAGALGWKVNGAGGAGGSASIVGPDDPHARADLTDALTRLPGVRLLDLSLDAAGCRPAPDSPTARS